MKHDARSRVAVATLALMAVLLALFSPASVSAADQSVDLSAPVGASATTAGCIPANVLFSDPAGDQQRVAQRMAANASPCASYYISVPPLAADKTALRPNVAGTIAPASFTGSSNRAAAAGQPRPASPPPRPASPNGWESSKPRP